MDLRSHAKVCAFCGLASSTAIFVWFQLAALVYIRLVLKVVVEKQPKVSVICLTTIYHCKYQYVRYRTENDRLDGDLVKIVGKKKRPQQIRAIILTCIDVCSFRGVKFSGANSPWRQTDGHNETSLEYNY